MKGCMKKALVFICIGLILAGLSGCVEEKRVKMDLIYVCDSENDRIVILDADLNYIDAFDIPGSLSPGGIAVDDEYIYVVVWQPGNDKVCKFNKTSPYAEVDSVEVLSAANQLAQDDNYIYLAEKSAAPPPDQHYYVTIIKKSDMSVSRFDAYPPSGVNNTMEGVAVDDDYIYCTGWTWLRKFDKGTHALVEENPSVGSSQNQIDEDPTYIYFINNDNDLKMYLKSNLSLYKTISDICTNDYPSGIAVVGDYAYMPAIGQHQVLKLEISTETIVATFGVYMESGSDDSHLYFPYGICIGPEEEEPQPIIALIG